MLVDWSESIQSATRMARCGHTRWTGTVEDHLKAERAKRKRPKVHKIIYRAEITGCDREKDNGLRLVVSSLLSDDPLVQAGLWCCLGAEEAAKTIDQYDRERTSGKNPLCPTLYWFEGYPAYVAGRDYIASVKQAALALGINPIAVGWAGGIKGAKAINLFLRPFDNDFIVKGISDASIVYRIVKHCIVVDNDKDGDHEGLLIGHGLKGSVDVQIIPPPAWGEGEPLPYAWDYADPLPPGWEDRRFDHLFGGNGIPYETYRDDHAREPRILGEQPQFIAQQFLADRYTLESDDASLFYWQDEWWSRVDQTLVITNAARIKGSWIVAKGIESEVMQYIADSWYWHETEKDDAVLTRFKATRNLCSDVLANMKSQRLLPAIEAPFFVKRTEREDHSYSWVIDDSREESADEYKIFGNGVVHIPPKSWRGWQTWHDEWNDEEAIEWLQETFTFSEEIDPLLFSISGAVPVSYDIGARYEARVQAFLKQVMRDDPECVETLLEFDAYCMTRDTSHQAILYMVGYEGSNGKGVCNAVSEEFLGFNNSVSTTLEAIGNGGFGLQNLINRSVGVIEDASNSYSDWTKAISILKTSSSGDRISVHRKFLVDWEGKMKLRWRIAANNPPKSNDRSSTLEQRFVVVPFLVHFERHSEAVNANLVGELTSVVSMTAYTNAVFRALARLNKRGYFKQPKAGAGYLTAFKDKSNQACRFFRDYCVVGGGTSVYVSQDELYGVFRKAMQDKLIVDKDIMSREDFLVEVYRVTGRTETVRRRLGGRSMGGSGAGRPKPCHVGIRLKEYSELNPVEADDPPDLREAKEALAKVEEVAADARREVGRLEQIEAEVEERNNIVRISERRR